MAETKPFAAACAAAEALPDAPGNAVIVATQEASGRMTFSRGKPGVVLELARAVLAHARPDAPAGDPGGARWIWCDLDGQGERWRLALPEGPGGVFFPLDDFSDEAENYADCPTFPITPPAPLPVADDAEG